MLAEKVVRFNNTKVYDQIEKFLTKHKYNSEGTEVAYRKDIELFFKVMKQKEIPFLSPSDVQLTLDDFEDFIAKLHDAEDENGERHYANKTINRKISTIKGLLKYLAGKKIVEDVSFLELIDSLPETTESYGALETHEVFTMANLASQERNKGDVKRLLILFALDTCIRKSALLNLKWSNFVEREDGVSVEGIDKGNKQFRHLISKEFYNELLTIKNNNEKVFDLTGRRLNDMVQRLKEKMQIADERRIVFHSIRKSGITFRYRVTGDLLEAQRAAGHSRLDTTRLYLQSEDYGVLGAVSTAGKLNENLYKEVEHDLLLEAISECKKDLKIILNMKIQEILKRSN